MSEFVVELAGCKIGVHALYESTCEYCGEYLSEGKETILVSVARADIDLEREKSACESIQEGRRPVAHSAAYLETIAVQRKVVEALYAYDTLLFHGSVVAVDGQAYLFTAKSGTGKSTHTRLWREMLGERAVMVNDDKPFLQIKEDKVLVWGSPWNGKHKLGTNICVPLKAICVLERGEENVIRPISAVEALPMLMQQSHRSTDPTAVAKMLQVINKLSTRVRFYRLKCNMDPEAAQVAYNGIFG